MTNETLAYYISYFNRGNISNDIDIQALNKTIDIAKIPAFFGQRKEPFEVIPKKKSFSRNFLIKNRDGEYIGVVHDMGCSNLHWYIRIKSRKNGHLTNALKEYILPFLSKEREYQEISSNKYYTGKCYNDSINIALNLGFTENGKDIKGDIVYKKILTPASQVA